MTGVEMNPLNKSMNGSAGGSSVEAVAVAVKETISPPELIGTADFPPGVQFLLYYMFGRESLTLPLCVFVLLLGVCVYHIATQYTYIVRLRDYYEDRGDQEGVDAAEAQFYQAIPSSVYALITSIEFGVNIKFGYWMACSRHLEMFAEKVSVWGVERETLFKDLDWVVVKIVPAITLLVIFIPSIIGMAVRSESLPTSDDGGDDPPPVLERNWGYDVCYTIAITLAFAMSMVMWAIWYWICISCYRYTQRSVATLEEEDFKTQQPLNTFVEHVSLMQETSAPWTFSSIVRMISMFYRSYFQGLQLLYLYYMMKHSNLILDGMPSGTREKIMTLFTVGIVTSALCTAIFFSTMLVGTMGTGYVGDSFLYAIKRKIRNIMGTSESEEVRRRLMEFSTMCTSFKGEAGLLFCGVEMSVEKGLYLVTIIGYLNSIILSNAVDPYANGDVGEDDGSERRVLSGDYTHLGGCTDTKGSKFYLVRPDGSAYIS